jgi:hypothetical protein
MSKADELRSIAGTELIGATGHLGAAGILTLD